MILHFKSIWWWKAYCDTYQSNILWLYAIFFMNFIQTFSSLILLVNDFNYICLIMFVLVVCEYKKYSSVSLDLVKLKCLN